MCACLFVCFFFVIFKNIGRTEDGKRDTPFRRTHQILDVPHTIALSRQNTDDCALCAWLWNPAGPPGSYCLKHKIAGKKEFGVGLYSGGLVSGIWKRKGSVGEGGANSRRRLVWYHGLAGGHLLKEGAPWQRRRFFEEMRYLNRHLKFQNSSSISGLVDMVPACLHPRFVSHINKDVIGLRKQLSLLAPLRRNFLSGEERGEAAVFAG